MQNVTYNLRDRRKEKEEKEALYQKLHWVLDSMGNDLLAILWLAQLALLRLQERDNLDQAKKNLQDALQAGDCAKRLMRMVFNSGDFKSFGTLSSRAQRESKVKRFKIYYSFRENGEYLQQVINSSGIGIVGETDNLKHLTVQGVRGTDVVVLEYHENNSKLDQWIQEFTANPQGPPIFLYFHKFSMEKLWKALHLGVKECLFFPVQAEQLRVAVNRIEDWSRTLTSRGGSAVKSRPYANITLSS